MTPQTGTASFQQTRVPLGNAGMMPLNPSPSGSLPVATMGAALGKVAVAQLGGFGWYRMLGAPLPEA